MIRLLTLVAVFSLTPAAFAGPDDFTYGPVFSEYGRVADVADAEALPDHVVLRVAFDVTEAGEPGEINRRLDTAARFINMHARAGVPVEDIHVAIVLHSRAAWDVTSDTWYGQQYEGADNANAALIQQLIDQGAQIHVCGQTAAHYDITGEDLLPGVEMALSAMTAHALLQQDGYTLNPF